MGLSCGATLFFVGGNYSAEPQLLYNKYSLPKPLIFATRGAVRRKKVKKIVQNQQKIRRRGLGDSPRQTGDSGMVFAHKGLVKGFCEEAKRRQKFAKTLFCAYLAPRNININS